MTRVSRCTSTDCGMRYPSPDTDPRRGTCPRCDAPTDDLGGYPAAVDGRGLLGAGIEIHALFDNIRSALNVGTMLRAADGARVAHVHLCGLTPDGDHPKVAKTALGAEKHVAWTHHLDATACASSLAAAGHTVWAIETTPTSQPLADAVTSWVGAATAGPLTVVLGNETAGVDPALLDAADRHVHLPMGGAKTTLNVGVAFGAVVYAIRTLERTLAGHD